MSHLNAADWTVAASGSVVFDATLHFFTTVQRKILDLLLHYRYLTANNKEHCVQFIFKVLFFN